MAEHPMQPLERDARGTARFKENRLVTTLLDQGLIDMNKLAVMASTSGCSFTREDRVQFAQLIGYSLGGFEELSYVSDADVRKAEAALKARENPPSVASALYEAAHKLGVEVSAMSWGGFNLVGDAASVRELQRLIACEARMRALENIVQSELVPLRKCAENLRELRSLEEWSPDDDGPALFHHIGEYGDICEAPIVAGGWEDLEDQQHWPGYYTHWSRLPRMPRFPLRSLKIAPPGSLACDWALDDV